MQTLGISTRTLATKSAQSRQLRCIHPAVYLVHLSDQLVDQVFPITQVSSFDKMLELPLPESAIGAVELKWPEKVGCLLEVRSTLIRYCTGRLIER